jgi:hypothetical protein
MPATLPIRLYQIICIAVIILIAGLRIHLAAVPFERDEGEYAYAGQMILRGSPPYQEVYNMKFPGVYYMYALSFRAFGESVSAPRYMVLLLQLAGAFFIFLLARRAIHPLAGWMSAAVYMIYNISLALQATQANTEHFLIAFLVPAMYFLWRGSIEDGAAIPPSPSERVRESWLFLSGLMVSLACLMKQHAFIFASVSVLWILYSYRMRSLRYVAVYLAGCILPLLMMAAYLWYAGVWSHFYFLTIQYAREYVGMTPMDAALHNLYRVYSDSKLLSSVLLWCSAVSILGLLWPSGKPRLRIFLALLLIASMAAVTPGLYFRRHYFILMVPVLSLLFAYTAFLLTGYLGGRLRYLLLAAYIAGNAFFFLNFSQRQGFFQIPVDRVVEWIYPGTPFVVSAEVSSYIERHSAPADRICLVGVEPQLFFLSHRRSASGYIYVYPLLEGQKYAAQMTDEFIRETERERPAVLVFSSHSVFEDGNHYDSKLYKWFTEYQKQYQLRAICSYQYGGRTFDTIAPMDTLPVTLPQVRVYIRKQP